MPDPASAGVCRSVLPPVDETAITLKLRPLTRRDRFPLLAHWRTSTAAVVVTIAAAVMLLVDPPDATSTEPAAAAARPRIVAARSLPQTDPEPVFASGALPVLEPIDDVVIVDDVEDEIVILDDPIDPVPPKTTRTSRRARARSVARIHMNKAATARTKGDLGVAQRELEAALAALPAYGPAAAALAEIHLKRRSYRSALRYAKRASRSAPRKLHYMLLLGDAYSMTNNRAAARKAWRKAAAFGSVQAKSRLAS